MYVLKWQDLKIPPLFNMYLVISKCITVLILENFSHYYLCNPLI